MTINEAVPLRSTIAARLNRLRWSPIHTRLAAGLGCRNNGGLGPQRRNLKSCRIGLHLVAQGPCARDHRRAESGRSAQVQRGEPGNHLKKLGTTNLIPSRR